MKENLLVLKAVQYIKADYNDYEIKNFLINEGAVEVEVDSIVQEAVGIIKEEQVETNSKKYKIFFVLFFMLFVISFYYFLYNLPAKIESTSILYSLLGSILICLFGILSFVYFRSWDKDKLRKSGSVNLRFDFLFFLMGLPVVIMYFIINSKFENVAKDILKKNYIEVVGTVINAVGKETVSGRITNIKIGVEFNTLEGEKIMVAKEVASYQFNQIREGQEVNVVYSKTNPHNNDVLLFDNDIRKFKNSLERDITHQDLVNLIGLEKEQAGVELNKIIFGWEYDTSEKAWFNKRKNIGVNVRENEVSYLSSNAQFPRFLLERDGFVVVNTNDSNNIITNIYGIGLLFKKGDLTAKTTIISGENGQRSVAVTTVIKSKI